MPTPDHRAAPVPRRRRSSVTVVSVPAARGGDRGAARDLDPAGAHAKAEPRIDQADLEPRPDVAHRSHRRPDLEAPRSLAGLEIGGAATELNRRARDDTDARSAIDPQRAAVGHPQRGARRVVGFDDVVDVDRHGGGQGQRVAAARAQAGPALNARTSSPASPSDGNGASDGGAAAGRARSIRTAMINAAAIAAQGDRRRAATDDPLPPLCAPRVVDGLPDARACARRAVPVAPRPAAADAPSRLPRRPSPLHRSRTRRRAVEAALARRAQTTPETPAAPSSRAIRQPCSRDRAARQSPRRNGPPDTSTRARRHTGPAGDRAWRAPAARARCAGTPARDPRPRARQIASSTARVSGESSLSDTRRSDPCARTSDRSRDGRRTQSQVNNAASPR